MLSKKIITGFVFFSLIVTAGHPYAQNDHDQQVKDVLYPVSGVYLTGYLATELNGSFNHRILAQDVDRLVEPFRPVNRTETRMWQSEFWGKWFTSAVLAYKYHPDLLLKKKLDHGVDALLLTQTADGYIGNYAETSRLQEWDIWGRKYCMLGLLAYYDLTKDKKAMAATIRLADNLISDLNDGGGIIVTKGNYRGMAASSVLEPICLLYENTGNKKYLDFALEIVRQWETPAGPQLISKANTNVGERFPKPKAWYSREQGQKAYEMMSCYEGLLELYRITGNPLFKKAVENSWENILHTEIDIAGSGASTEMWFGGKAVENLPIHHFQETCVTVTWLKLSEQLLRLTGESKYADEVEKTYYNALLGSMSNQGSSWAKYSPLNGQRLPGSEQCGMGLNCCEASGPRGLFNLPQYIVTERKDGLQINYFADGTYRGKTPIGGKINLTQYGGYPKSGDVAMDIEIDRPEVLEIRIRIPAWSRNTKLFVNGTAVDNVHCGEYAVINRNWVSGDKILLQLDMRGRVIETGISMHSMAIMRGPIVLARDARFEGAGIEAVFKPVSDSAGYIKLVEAQNNTGDHIYMVYKAEFIPESYTENAKGPVSITLCDYASAGNGKENSFYKVWSAQLINRAKE